MFDPSYKVPIPNFFNPSQVQEIYRVPYQQRAREAKIYAQQNNLKPASEDKTRICLLLIDVQNTFCLPEFELFVGGKSGMGAVEDNIRLCEFIYGNLDLITEIIPTMDTHTAMQIFHPIFWVNNVGQYPEPATTISLEAVEKGEWKVNPDVAYSLTNGNHETLEKYALHYVKKLSDDEKYPLTIWPYHSMLGGIGHALVSAVEEAVFFHNIARNTQTNFELKGNNPLTENYSVLRPEVLTNSTGKTIANKNSILIEKLLDFDKVIITGQAKSHCLAWTVDDLLTEIQSRDINLAQKIYLLEDCTSPVVIPGIIDFTTQADSAFQKFADAGMNIIRSTDVIV